MAIDTTKLEQLKQLALNSDLDLGFNFMPYMEKVGGYRHLPLEFKKKLLQPFVDAGKRVTVCEDHPEHYEWFKTNFNPNPDDCCDLRR